LTGFLNPKALRPWCFAGYSQFDVMTRS